MVKISRFLAYSLFFILSLMYFTPKASAYYFLEQQLKDYSVVISKEDIIDSGLSLNISDASISYKSIESANVSNMDVSLFVVYNTIHVKDITISSVAKTFMPLHVKNLDIKYSIFNPLNIVATCSGEFGEADATISIVNRVLHLTLKPSKVMLSKYKNTLKNLKKSENGEYVYEKNI